MDERVKGKVFVLVDLNGCARVMFNGAFFVGSRKDNLLLRADFAV